MLENILIPIVKDKNGVEIGGPSSDTGHLVYEHADRLDNIIFSTDTIWSKHHEEDYCYYQDKKGRVIINDAVDLSSVSDSEYDFVFSSHCLEHIANPLKAIREWLRIVREDGHIILVVPEKSCCFDHRREYSDFSVLLSQYQKNVGEEDLSTLPEILSKHDLSMDPPAGDLRSFAERSLNNYQNRCLHHYVYDDTLLLRICDFFHCAFVYKETRGLHRWFIMKKSIVNI